MLRRALELLPSCPSRSGVPADGKIYRLGQVRRTGGARRKSKKKAPVKVIASLEAAFLHALYARP